RFAGLARMAGIVVPASATPAAAIHLGTRLIHSERPPARILTVQSGNSFSASSLFGISTKPKPRDRPVARSVTTVALSTVPNGANRDRSSSSERLKEKLPTKIFFMEVLFTNVQDGSQQK